MSELTLDGATLHYETVGAGPVLIFVPGANGTGDIFRQAAENLKDDYKVVMYDRRNFGKSKLTKPLPDGIEQPHDSYRIKTDASDLAALAKEVSNEPVSILGSSSGSIVVMETLQDYPEIFKRALIHESPINVFLPDSEQQQANNQTVVDIAQKDGMMAAMKAFGKFMRIGAVDAQMMSKPATNVSDIKDAAKTATDAKTRSQAFWFENEIRQYTSRQIDFSVLEQHRDKLVLLVGTGSTGSFPAEVTTDISSKLNVPITAVPAGHLGYAQEPEGFAKVLKKVLA
ncbi:alpha/beta hydrolase [Loigolactobacillus backii]|uniref:Hydrolase n=1 Tax=Loigolactobacillus backii TaxID=375175 RepID=A0A192GZH4_9LACO|nr:alpha/beta hydrolase [Loigolactobacillus backii]ANK61438.1 hydrolase [Loigolactobacillus backii]ANK69362.1 hydrolase [Loigolactobacillus backii]MDA5387779.1 alpha/beta hydrolase [Loigolactobacillus backii]MDA5390931.1 alpha/beta hydrolase [Loigolactobacillus backii]PIO84188.1 alpha/beta hydrolase [Loigolactobacillus backii]